MLWAQPTGDAPAALAGNHQLMVNHQLPADAWQLQTGAWVPNILGPLPPPVAQPSMAVTFPAQTGAADYGWSAPAAANPNMQQLMVRLAETAAASAASNVGRAWSQSVSGAASRVQQKSSSVTGMLIYTDSRNGCAAFTFCHLCLALMAFHT